LQELHLPKRPKLIFSRTNWLVGSGIFMNSFGITQHVGETGAIGLGVVAINAGKIERTTEEQPEGGLGTFNPSFYNISLSYAKGFQIIFMGVLTLNLFPNKYPMCRHAVLQLMQVSNITPVN